MLSFMARKHILILVPGKSIFGQERALINVGLALRDAGHDVTIGVHDDWGEDVVLAISKLGLNHLPLPLGTIWSGSFLLKRPLLLVDNLIALRKSNAAISSFHGKNKIDCIITGNTSFTHYILAFKKRFNIPMIFRHGDDNNVRGYIDKYVKIPPIVAAEANVFNCDFLKNKFAIDGAVLSKRVIRNFPYHLPDPDQPDARDSTLRDILYVGQIAHHKGVGELVSAAEALLERYGFLNFNIVGSRPGTLSRQDLEVQESLRHVESRFPDRFKVASPGADVARFYQAADLLICPSIWEEPSPNVIVEANFFGLPVVAFANGGIPELVKDGENGFLCPQPTSDSLISTIETLLTDASAFKTLRHNARQASRSGKSRENFLSSWVTLFEDVTVAKSG